jgi:F-type H+-transporting ATPase subunit b
MELILKQVGELLLGAIPTVVLLLSLYVAYHFLVHKPLLAVLAERRSRTEGAVEKARADIAAAEAKTAEYEARLREAKVVLFKQQEARRKQAQEARAAAVAAARARAEEQVRQARAVLQQEMATAKLGLQAESERLANEIIRAILQPAGTGHAPAVGGKS